MLDLDVTNSIGSGAEGLPAELNEDPDYVVSDRPKRDRKPVTLYKADTVNESKSSSTIIEVGKGIQLSNYPYFVKGLDKYKGSDELVRCLHSLMFGCLSKKLEAKKNIRLFSGFNDSIKKDDKIAKISENKKKWTVGLLKSVLELVGVERSGTREELILRLVDYLMCPKVIKTEEALVGAKKRKSSVGSSGTGSRKKSQKTAKSSDKKKEKQPLSAYILYSQSIRTSLKEGNPEATFAELSRLCGQKWRDLEDDEKNRWKDKATELAALSATTSGPSSNGDDVAEEDTEEEEEEEADENEEREKKQRDIFGESEGEEEDDELFAPDDDGYDRTEEEALVHTEELSSD